LLSFCDGTGTFAQEEGAVASMLERGPEERAISAAGADCAGGLVRDARPLNRIETRPLVADGGWTAR
jgi:hypothetical protein